MRTIKCKYCGKSYASPSEMRKRKCHSHPKGAWGGYCTPDSLDEFLWGMGKNREERENDYRKLEENRRIEEEKSERYKAAYRQHTPLLDLWGTWYHDEPQESDLQIWGMDLNSFAAKLANGINKGEETRDAINTVYALRAGCDYVLNNEDVQKERGLYGWLFGIKQLKDEVVNWDFWGALYWLTKLIKDQSDAAEKAFESNRENWRYWKHHTIAWLFHQRMTFPMLCALNFIREVDREELEKGKEVMKTVTSYVRGLKSKEKGFERIFEMLDRRICEGSFWAVLYCLQRIELRPTPWNDQKVWPIRAAQKDAKAQAAPAKHQATKPDKSSDFDKQPSKQKDDDTPLKELEGLIGLGRVKDGVRKLVELVKFNAARKAKGLSAGGMTSHFVFTGNPGTGKTTVARIIAGIYRQLGILKKGHLIEVDRSKLVAGYVGHTAIQTNAVVDSAMDGVLFIDEAYSLVAGGKSDFGSEAIATLLKRMEDARERIIVIVAGYSDEMRRFVKSNPGLESRFTKFIEFPDYSIDELASIFGNIVKKNQFICSPKGQELARKTIEAAAVDGHVSGNARYVRNLFNAVRERMARRVMKIENASMIQLQTIEAEDFVEQVGGTLQQSMPPSTAMNVNSESEQPTASEVFNMSQYLKDLRGTTLGLKDIWTNDGTHGWETVLPNGPYLACWMGAVKTQLILKMWVGCSKWTDFVGDFISEPHFRITHDGKCFLLSLQGQFWGDSPEAEINTFIDFAADDIQPDLAAAKSAYCVAWGVFSGNVNKSIDLWDGGIFWDATIPFKDHDELVSGDFSQKLRKALSGVANAFASLLKYRIPVNP